MKFSVLGQVYQLDENTIHSVVKEKSPGYYILGNMDKNERFVGEYAGRSDTDIKIRLLSWVGNPTKHYFTFHYTHNADEAFLSECRLFHEMYPPENTFHPDKPAGSGVHCPFCGK